MRTRADIECWLTDMDGVLVHENTPIPGAAELLQQWRDAGTPFLVLTNNSIFTPRDLSARLRASGLFVPEDPSGPRRWRPRTSCAARCPAATAFVIGEAGLTTALHEAGFIMTETDPDYVVVGETRNYSFEAITKAIRFIAAGARFIATNPDATGPSVDGVLPATGAIAALITKAIGKEPYVVGKPNPMMFRSALNRIGAHSENTGMIGDRMDTDIVAGIEAGLHTVLVLTGISDPAEIERYPFRPDEILDSVADLLCGRSRSRPTFPRSDVLSRADADGSARRRREGHGAGCRGLARLARGEPRDLQGRVARPRRGPGRTSSSSATRTRSCRRCASAGSTDRCAASTSRPAACGSRRAARRAGGPRRTRRA